MNTREYVKIEIDTLPEVVIDKVREFILFQKYSLGLYDNDTEYLSAIPGMTASIKAAAIEPLEDGIDAAKVDFNV